MKDEASEEGLSGYGSVDKVTLRSGRLYTPVPMRRPYPIVTSVFRNEFRD